MMRAGLTGRFGRVWRTTIAVLLGLIVMGAAMMPCGAAADTIEIDQQYVVAETGQARMTMVYKIPAQSYVAIKQIYGNNLYLLFTNLTNPRASLEIDKDTLKISADDVRCCINVSATLIGYAVCRRNRWEIPLNPKEQIKHQGGNSVFTQETSLVGYNTILNINTTYTLPAAATNVSRDNNRNLLVFTLPHTRVTSGTGSAMADVRYRAEIMPAVYKIYNYPRFNNGEFWVAKVVFRNTGRVPIYDLKFYYKLGEYTDQETTDRYNVVMPGGAVVDLFYPNISDRVVQLKNRTPVRLSIRYEYTDPSGRVVAEDLQERLDILGLNQFCWSGLTKEERIYGSFYEAFNNAPLIAALVTKNDPVIRQFVGMVSQMAKGVPANNDDKSALVWLKAAYDLMWYNNIVYQTPSGFLTPQAESVQEVKFPRDVLIDKAGTCVDLAILYATVAEATGLDANIMLIPGHAFAVITLPSGNLLPVENTLIAGGRSGHGTFEQALAVGLDHLSKLKDYIFVRVHDLLAEGVPNPELPAVSPTLLKDLGYTVPGDTDTYTSGGTTTTAQANTEIFYDDFSNTGTGWLVDRSKDEGTAYNGGEYEVRIFKKIMYSYSAPVKTTIPARYLVQTDARVATGANRGYYALVFNLQSWDSFYYLLMVDPSRQSYSIVKSERGNLRTLLDWTKSNLINTSGKNTLTAWVDGNRAATFINGKAVTEWFDLGDVASPPKVGVSAGNFVGFFTVNVRFDNFMVIGNPQ